MLMPKVHSQKIKYKFGKTFMSTIIIISHAYLGTHMHVL